LKPVPLDGTGVNVNVVIFHVKRPMRPVGIIARAAETAPADP
jgi:hypothetical protein